MVVVLGARVLAWPIAMVASFTSFLISLTLLLQVMDGSIISYHLGGWAPPLGIEYRIDAANAFVPLTSSRSAVATPDRLAQRRAPWSPSSYRSAPER